jgi:hypothetical protein
MVTNVEGQSKEVATATVTQAVDSDSLVSATQENIHSNLRIQQDMELWRLVREYDKETAEMSFTSVLSKKQKQHLKKVKIGKCRTEPTLEVRPL